MAKITNWMHGAQDVKPHPTAVTCFYQVITDGQGKQILHLSTFGSSQRQSAPKSSQSIQMDLDNARALVKVLVESFGPSVLDSQ